MVAGYTICDTNKSDRREVKNKINCLMGIILCLDFLMLTTCWLHMIHVSESFSVNHYMMYD
jgi:hypothetical protein